MTLAAPTMPTGRAAGVVPHRAVARLASRQVRRGALIVAALSAAMTATVSGQYQSTFRGALDSTALQALTENPAIRVLFGPPVALDDPGGFTVWRTGTPVLVLAGVWALLAAIRITRGEEDSGRWDLLLAGRLRIVDVVSRCLLVLTAAAGVIGVAVAVGLLATGTDPVGAIVYSSGVFLATLTFATVGLLAAQVMPSKGGAVGLGIGILGFCLLLRMAADGVPQLAWSAWVTPFGLISRSAPFSDNGIAPLVVLAGYATLMSTLSFATAQRRDLGAGLLRVRTRRPARLRLLRSLGGFAVRRAVKPAAGWAAGIAAYFVLVGALIVSINQFLTENQRFTDLATTAGFVGLDSVNGFVAAMFSLLAIPVSLYAATRLAAMAADETDRRWTTLFAAPVTRARIVCTELAVTAAGAVLLLAVAALAVWTGAMTTGAPLDLGAALSGALNTAPVTWLGLGAAAFALGWLPHAVGAIGAMPVAGGFLLDVIVKSAGLPSWLASISPFAHLAGVPDAPADWTASATMTAIAVGMAVLGLVGYGRRDLNT